MPRPQGNALSSDGPAPRTIFLYYSICYILYRDILASKTITPVSYVYLESFEMER